MRVLYVGDPHVTVSEMADGWALIELVNRTASEHEVDAVVFLGDQYHHSRCCALAGHALLDASA